MSRWNHEDERVASILRERSQRLGFDRLEPFEQEYVAIDCLVGDTMNGGFDQCFHNSTGDLAEYAAKALDIAGAPRTLGALREAMALIPGGWSGDRRERRSRLRGMPPNAFAAVNRRFYAYPEDVLVLAIAVVRREYAARGLLGA